MSADEYIQALLDGDRHARDAAAFALRRLPFDPQALVPVLQHPHVSRQVKAIEALRYSRTREAVELLVGMLATQNPIVARKAASSLGRIGAIAPDAIASALDSATTSEHRLNILDVLSRLQHPRGREVLLVHADAWEPSDRKRALDYLRRYRADAPGDEIVETIRGALADPETQYTAADVAGRIRDPSFLEPLLDLYLSSDDSPSRTVGAAIAKFGAAAIEPLLARIGDPRLDGRIERALSRLVWRLDETAFWQLWDRSVTPARDACLDHMHPNRGYDRARCIAAITEYARDPDRNRRIHCVHAFERFGAIDALQALASDPDADVRRRAEWALQALANRR